MKSKHLQYGIGLIFLTLGGWALLFPGEVEMLGFTPDYYIGTVSSSVLIGCFGAQAILCSILIFFTEFKPNTFLIFGIAGSFPFIFFNYYFLFVIPVFNQWMVIDFMGNIGIFVCCLWGYFLKEKENQELSKKTQLN